MEAVARRAARFSRWSFPRFAERVDLARFALLEHVYTCEAGKPSGCDLVMVGIRAVDRQIVANERALRGGVDPVGGHAWDADAAVLRVLDIGGRADPLTGRPDRGHARAVADLAPAGRVGPGRDPGLARHRDYELAAKELNITHNSFKDSIYRARHRFLRLWHEHEQPSGMWSRDFRLTRPRGYRTNSIASTITQRRRLQKKKLPRSAPALRTETDGASIEAE